MQFSYVDISMFVYLMMHVHLFMLSLNVEAALWCTNIGRHSINYIWMWKKFCVPCKTSKSDIHPVQGAEIPDCLCFNSTCSSNDISNSGLALTDWGAVCDRNNTK